MFHYIQNERKTFYLDAHYSAAARWLDRKVAQRNDVIAWEKRLRKSWTDGLSSLDPFDAVDLIVRSIKEILDYELMAALSINKDRLLEGCTTVQDGEDKKWEDPNDDGCAFDLFDDDE